MRKSYFLTLFVIPLLLVACSSGEEVVTNPLLGKWELISVQNKQGEIESAKEGEHYYMTFFPDKITMGDNSAAVIDYAVEDKSVTVTVVGINKKKGEQKVMRIQLLEGDQIKWEPDDNAGMSLILRRVNDAEKDSSVTGIIGQFGGKKCAYDVLDFRSGGKIYIKVLGSELPGTYEVDGDKISIMANGEGIVFTRSGDVLDGGIAGKCSRL